MKKIIISNSMIYRQKVVNWFFKNALILYLKIIYCLKEAGEATFIKLINYKFFFANNDNIIKLQPENIASKPTNNPITHKPDKGH